MSQFLGSLYGCKQQSSGKLLATEVARYRQAVYIEFALTSLSIHSRVVDAKLHQSLVDKSFSQSLQISTIVSHHHSSQDTTGVIPIKVFL